MTPCTCGHWHPLATWPDDWTHLPAPEDDTKENRMTDTDDTPTLDDATLAEIRDRVEPTTPGPWRHTDSEAVYDAHEAGLVVVSPEGDPVALVADEWYETAEDEPTPFHDAEFIAHARTDVPLLMAEVERLRVELALSEGEREDLDTGAGTPLGENVELEAEVADLRSRLACVLEASYWDRAYDERLAAIRGMCDLTTNGMTPKGDAAPSDAPQDEDAVERALMAWRVSSWIPWPTLSEDTARRMIRYALDAAARPTPARED